MRMREGMKIVMKVGGEEEEGEEKRAEKDEAKETRSIKCVSRFRFSVSSIQFTCFMYLSVSFVPLYGDERAGNE
jgi:hypothetical protein